MWVRILVSVNLNKKTLMQIYFSITVLHLVKRVIILYSIIIIYPLPNKMVASSWYINSNIPHKLFRGYK